MTNEEAIKGLKSLVEIRRKYGDMQTMKDEIDCLDMAIKALEQESCEDAISRQATVERLCKVAKFMNEKRKDLGSPYIMAALFIQGNKDEFPSVTPQSKTGRWIIIDDCEQFIAKCSECGRIEDSRMIDKYPYCHCGAKMEAESEE